MPRTAAERTRASMEYSRDPAWNDRTRNAATRGRNPASSYQLAAIAAASPPPTTKEGSPNLEGARDSSTDYAARFRAAGSLNRRTTVASPRQAWLPEVRQSALRACNIQDAANLIAPPAVSERLRFVRSRPTVAVLRNRVGSQRRETEFGRDLPGRSAAKLSGATE
jgi:hypothetical protein